MPIAFSYVRMSTKAQEQGDSLRRQLEAARRWAAANGYVLDETMVDIGVSAHRGKHRKKGSLANFLQRVHEGAIPARAVLLIENVDRLSREPVLTALDTFRQLLRSGVGVVILDMGWILSEDGLNSDTGWQLQPLISLMQRAHNESVVKSQRGLAAMETKRRRASSGVPFSKTGPGWLRKDKDKWIEDKERADIVREMFNMASDGAGSYRIAVEFNQRGYQTFGGSKFWGSSYISKTLRNEAVVGTWQPHREGIDGKIHKVGEPIIDHYPAVVTRSLFLKVQKEILPKFSSGAKGKHYKNLFSGRCWCARCGYAMHVFTVAKWPAP